MKPLSENLTVLAATAEDLVRKQPHYIPTELPRGFPELAAEIRRAHASPSEGVRATGAGSIMCDAIEGFYAGNAGDDRYQMIIGVTLPLLRREAWQARNNERDQTRGER
jgi:hypothetical protein